MNDLYTEPIRGYLLLQASESQAFTKQVLLRFRTIDYGPEAIKHSSGSGLEQCQNLFADAAEATEHLTRRSRMFMPDVLRDKLRPQLRGVENKIRQAGTSEGALLKPIRNRLGGR